MEAMFRITPPPLAFMCPTQARMQLWVSGRSAEAGREQDHACSGAHLRRDTLHIIAGRALQV